MEAKTNAYLIAFIAVLIALGWRIKYAIQHILKVNDMLQGSGIKVGLQFENSLLNVCRIKFFK